MKLTILIIFFYAFLAFFSKDYLVAGAFFLPGAFLGFLYYLDRRKKIDCDIQTTPLWKYCRDNNIKYYYDVVDVTRKKDL